MLIDCRKSQACIRFHVATLLGQKPDEKTLPRPASLEDRKSWMFEKTIRDIDINPDDGKMATWISEQVNPCFPIAGGPGHEDATPQQLSIIWQMMQAVSLSSFHPDFSISPSSKYNKWLWEFAFRSFLKLVGCGEYVGVSIEENNLNFIKKCLKSHVDTLTRRYVHVVFLCLFTHSGSSRIHFMLSNLNVSTSL